MQKQTVKKISSLALGSSMLLLGMIPAASAFASTAPAVTGVTLTSTVAKTASATVGSNVTFTASATQTGSGTPEYQFWVDYPNGTWKDVTPGGWTTNNSYTLSNVQNGSYEVVVYAHDKGQTVPVNSEQTGTNQFVNVGSTFNFTTSSNDVAPLSTVTIKAMSTNLNNPVYQFWVGTPDSNAPGGYSWAALNVNGSDGNYSSADTATFTPSTSGKYMVAVYAKDLNAPSDNAPSSLSKGEVVGAFGSAANVQVSPSAVSVVADGVASGTIHADIVDANGIVVGNDNTSTVTINGASGGTDPNTGNPYIVDNGLWIEGGTVNGGTETFTVSGGVADITAIAPESLGAGSATVTVNYTDPAGATHVATATVNYTSAVATKFNPNPTSTLISSGSSNVQIPIQVLDAQGNALTSGVYTVTATLSGDAYFPGNTQSQQFTFAGGSGYVDVNVPAYVSSGSATLTISGSEVGGNTLQTGSVNLQIGQPGAAAKIALTTGTLITSGSISASNVSGTTLYTGQIEDANGFATTSGLPSTVNYNIVSGGQSVASGTAPVTNSGTFSIGGTTAEHTAGSYTVEVSEPGLTGTTDSFAVTPGAPSQIAMSPSVATDVLASNPTETVTASVEDQFGNVVTSSTALLTFTATNSATVNGSTSSVAVQANNGVATVTVTLPTGVGTSTTVTASGTSLTSGTETIKEVGLATTNVSVTTGASSYVAGTAAGTSGTAMFTIKPTDNYGDLASGDVVVVTLPNGLFGTNVSGDFHGVSGATEVNGNPDQYSMTTQGTAITFYGATPAAVGNYTVKAQDISSPSQPSGTASVAVTTGAPAEFALVDAAGNNLSLGQATDTVASGSSLTLTLEATDAAGNAVRTDATYTVTLPELSSGSGLSWRLSPSGADVSTVAFTPGETSTTVYLVNGTAGTVTVNSSSATTGSVDAAYVSGTSGTQLEAAIAATTATVSLISPSNGTSLSGTTLTTTSGTITTIELTVDQSGTALANQPVYLSVSGGTVNATEVYTNAAGQAEFSYTAPTGSVSGSITYTIGGGGQSGQLPNLSGSITVN